MTDLHKERTSWAARDDAFLDLGLDGRIDQSRELAFAKWTENDGTDTDLEALGTSQTWEARSAGRESWPAKGLFDTNKDGVFDAQDARWDEFRVWQDIDQDGEVDHDTGELRTLDGRIIAAGGFCRAA